jgi:hypothetical protein
MKTLPSDDGVVVPSDSIAQPPRAGAPNDATVTCAKCQRAVARLNPGHERA